RLPRAGPAVGGPAGCRRGPPRPRHRGSPPPQRIRHRLGARPALVRPLHRLAHGRDRALRASRDARRERLLELREDALVDYAAVGAPSIAATIESHESWTGRIASSPVVANTR